MELMGQGPGWGLGKPSVLPAPVEMAQPLFPPGLRQTYSCWDQSRSEWVEAAVTGRSQPEAWSEALHLLSPCPQ